MVSTTYYDRSIMAWIFFGPCSLKLSSQSHQMTTFFDKLMKFSIKRPHFSLNKNFEGRLKLNSCTYPFWFSSLFLPRRTPAHVRCLRARRANVRKTEENYSRLLLLISFQLQQKLRRIYFYCHGLQLAQEIVKGHHEQVD